MTSVSGDGRHRAPWNVLTAAWLCRVYGLVLSGLGVVLAAEQLTGRGDLGSEHLTGLALRGVVTVVTLLVLVAVLLWAGAWRLLRLRRPLLMVVPMVCFIAVGTIGETVDLLGTASAGSDMVGLGILALAALPLLLLTSRGARRWMGENRPRPGCSGQRRGVARASMRIRRSGSTRRVPAPTPVDSPHDLGNTEGSRHVLRSSCPAIV